MTPVLLVVGCSFVAGLTATFAARAAARRVGLVDRPDGRRKLQTQPVALAGGLGVLAGAALGLFAAAGSDPEVAAALAGDPARVVALAAGCVGIAALGLVDDLVNLRARHKVLGQLLAALVLVVPGGYCIDRVTLFGQVVELGTLAVPVTCLWFLAAINAVNLLDGMDGLLGTVGVIVLTALAAMAAVVGDSPLTLYVAVAGAGTLAGFLVFNLPPASVYLGDCGSMVIGLVIAALAISASLKGPAVAILAPTALLVLPILDTSAAVVRRKLTGRGLAAADRGHLHHEMLRSGKSRGRVLGITTVLGTIGAAGGVVGLAQQNDFFALGAGAAVLAILLATGWFGLAEVRLIRGRAGAMLRSAGGRADSVQLSVRLQGTAAWAGLWSDLTRAAEEESLQSLRLDVNAPAWHEAFHARWDRSDSGAGPPPDPLAVWRLELPVYGHGQVIGKLTVVGRPGVAPIDVQLARLSGLLHDAETLLGPQGDLARGPALTA